MVGLVRGQEEIKVEVSSFFKQLYSMDGACDPILQANSCQPVSTVRDRGRQFTLEKHVSKQEIWEILRHFAKDKSPGPDDWTMEFFTQFFRYSW
jgi:hypothetical protein